MASTSYSATESSKNSSIKQPSQIIISVDLARAVIDYLAYLKEFYDHPEYFQKASCNYAIYRYETFWLPFLAENIELDIVPPLDILLVWHSHMLAPTTYANDCERLFGSILPYRIRRPTSQIIQFSEQLWAKKYRHTMPYHLGYTTNIQVVPPYTSKIKYALNQAIERQADFYYNVSLGHYKDPIFLNEAIERYKKFIFLKRLNPQLCVVPVYDIDVIWRTHQLFPDIYRHDMITNLRYVLHHDDTKQGHSSNSNLSASDRETCHKWFSLYGDRLRKTGCMYRGKTSKSFYQYVTDFNFLIECQRYSLYVQFINNVATSNVTKEDMRVETNTVVSLHNHLLGERVHDQLFAQFNTSDQEIFALGSSGHVEAHFEADFSDFSTKLTLKIQQRAGYWPINYFTTIEEYEIPPENLTPIIQSNQPFQAVNSSTDDNTPNGLFYILDKTNESESPLQKFIPAVKRLVVGIPVIDINTVIVRYNTTEYQEVMLDQNNLAQLGTTFLFNLENFRVRQALHNIRPLHQDDPILLNIRHTIINDINIFTATFSSAIFASCHTLNWSQLPLSNQVSNEYSTSAITLNPEYEEALVIKDHTGDWGIVKFSKNFFTSTLEAVTDESCQFTLYRFMPDGHTEKEIIFIDWDDKKWLVGSNNFGIDMHAWSISVSRTELANSIQYICLGSALISRFDALFTEIFENNDAKARLATVNETKHGNDLLANAVRNMNLNGASGIDYTRNKLNSSNFQMVMNNV